MIPYTHFTYEYQGKAYTYSDSDDYMQYNHQQHYYQCRVPVTIQADNSTIFIHFKLNEDEMERFHSMVKQGIRETADSKN